MLRIQTKSDEGFLAVLRDFVAEHSGGAATTEDFQEVLTRHFPGNWNWFFDQWIYGAEIPTIEYDWRAEKRADADGLYLLEVDLGKRDVPSDFVIPVPIKVEIDGNKTAIITAVLVEDKTTFEYRLPARIRKVEVNPDNAILARMDKK